jgi:hypothetical protein
LAAALARLAVAGATLPLLAAGDHRMLWEFDETGHYKSATELALGYASHDFFAILDAQQWRKSRRFRVIAAEYSDLVKLDLIITEEAPAEAGPLSLACKLQILVLSSKEE